MEYLNHTKGIVFGCIYRVPLSLQVTPYVEQPTFLPGWPCYFFRSSILLPGPPKSWTTSMNSLISMHLEWNLAKLKACTLVTQNCRLHIWDAQLKEVHPKMWTYCKWKIWVRQDFRKKYCQIWGRFPNAFTPPLPPSKLGHLSLGKFKIAQTPPPPTTVGDKN